MLNMKNQVVVFVLLRYEFVHELISKQYHNNNVIKTKVKFNLVYDKNTFCSHHQIIGYIAYNNLSFLNEN